MSRPDAFTTSVSAIARRREAPSAPASTKPRLRRQGGLPGRGPSRAKRRWAGDGLVRETFTMSHDDARAKARDYLDRYPRQAYMTRVEHWRRLGDGAIEFTMVRLPTAD